MKIPFALILIAFLLKSLSAKAAPVPAAPVVVKADAVLAQRLETIDALLAKKDLTGAIQSALNLFPINASQCRAIETSPVGLKDENGNEAVAHTRLDQTVVLDPNQTAFRNARYLVSVLAHETTHCDQHQKMYELAMAADNELAPAREKIPFLRTLADLEDLAEAALKDPKSAETSKKYKEAAAKAGVDLPPAQLSSLAKRVVEAVLVYKRTLNELNEIEASLKAFEIPGVLAPPKSGGTPSDEFQFQYQFLMLSTNKLLKMRLLFGAKGPVVCKLGNFVPFGLTMQHERNCTEAVRMLEAYFPKQPAS